jgi:hypothetical protein
MAFLQPLDDRDRVVKKRKSESEIGELRVKEKKTSTRDEMQKLEVRQKIPASVSHTI